MSALLSAAKGALGGFTAGGFGGGVVGAVSGFFGGGGGDVNIANSLSKQVGCTIRQTDANQARAMLASGVNPCTGQNTRAPGFDVGIPAQTINLTGGPSSGAATPIPVFGPGGATVSTKLQTQGASGLEFTSTGLIRSVVVNGRRISRKNAAAFIRKAGMDVGATGLGLSLQQAAMVVLQQSARPRRRKGISGAQITQAKRVINTINSMAKSLGACSPARRRAPARKTSCR